MISLAIAGYEIALCALCAAIFLVLVGLASVEQAIASIEWEVVIMVAFSFGLGSAMEKSGFMFD